MEVIIDYTAFQVMELFSSNQIAQTDSNNAILVEEPINVASMSRRSIREVHDTRDSFRGKRLMEIAIFIDLIVIALNFQFWTIFLFDDEL